MKVMLIGGTGVLSKDIAKRCIDLKYDVYMINRGKRLKYAPDQARVIIGDINNTLSIASQIENLKFDVVVDFLSYTSDQLSRTLSLFRNKCSQFIFISSATAYSTESPNEFITENTSTANCAWKYAKDKILCERLLEEEYIKNGIQYTIVRPYITYGNTRIPYAFISKKQPWTLIDRILNDKPVVVWDDGETICTLTHTKDFAKGVVGLFGNSNAYRQAFHITSDENFTWTEVLNYIGEAVGKTPNIINISSDLIEENFKEMRGELLGDKAITRRFDNTKIKTTVKDFSCSIKFRDGIKDTIEYYKNTPELLKIDNEWNAKVDILIHRLSSKNKIDNSFIYNKIPHFKNLSIVSYYKIYGKIKWFSKALNIRLARVFNKYISRRKGI